MNVLFVDQFSSLGGAQFCLLDLLPAVAARGGTLVAALPGPGPLLARARALGLDVRGIPCGPYRNGPKNTADVLRFCSDAVRQARILRHIAEEFRIDLIYANGPRVWPAAAMASRGKIPLVVHAHNHIAQTFAARVARWAIRYADASVISCCESICQSAAGPKLAVIPNGTADCGYRARAFQGKLRIGMIGQIVPEKGHLEFLRAATRLRSPLEFVISGALSAAEIEYFHAVRDAARGLPVEFTGWRDDIAQVLAGLDLLVIPSRQEAMPRVMLEAMSAGVPVVAFDVGGIGEVIEDGVTGFLAAPGALKEGIARAIGDAHMLQRVAAAARALWERNHTVRQYRDAVMRVLDRALEAPAAWRTAARPPYTPSPPQPTPEDSRSA